jgi:transposase
MAKQQRKHRSPQEKADLLRRHLLDKQPVSAVCEEAGVQPSNFYNWQRQLLDNAAAAFGDPERASRRERELQEKIAALEARLARKDAVIAEITGEYVALKKELGEP